MLIFTFNTAVDYLTFHESAAAPRQPARWFIIPANHKWFRNLAVVRIVAEYLDGLLLKYPKPNVDIARIRHKFHGLRA